MEISGKIKMIDQTKEIGTSGFKKRDMVITTDEQYPQHILVQFVQDKCAILDGYKVGENVTVAINLRGREWTNPQGETVYFNTIQAWRIERITVGQNSPPPAQNTGSATAAYEAKNNPLESPANEEEPDDLPF